MTAKVASPASPAEDLACRGPLKAKRLLYTEDQLSFTRKVSQTPTKQGHSVVCAAFIRLFMSLGFLLLFFFFFTFLFTFIPALLLVFPMTFTESSKLLFSLLPSCRSTVAQCLVRGLYLVYLLNPTPRSKPQLVAKVATLRPRLTAPKQEAGNSGQLVLLSGTLACHAFNSLSCCLFPL